MSNIDKQALRQHAEHIIELEGDEAICHRVLIDAYEKSDQLFTAQNVLALLDELEAKDRRNAELEDLLEAEIKSWMQRYDSANNRREAAEKRIAELEARMVKLPERYEVDMCPTPSPDGEWYSREDVLSALASAGLKVAAAGKGE